MKDTIECYQTIKERMIPVLENFLQKTEVGTLPNSFYEANLTLIPKPNKDITRQENCRPVSLMNIEAKCSTKY